MPSPAPDHPVGTHTGEQAFAAGKGGKLTDVGTQRLRHIHPAHVGQDRRHMFLLQMIEKAHCRIFDEKRYQANARHVLQFFVFIHLRFDVLGMQHLLEFGVKHRRHRFQGILGAEHMAHIDRVEKVARRLAGIIVAQVHRQADGNGFAFVHGGAFRRRWPASWKPPDSWTATPPSCRARASTALTLRCPSKYCN